ncbi:MAG: hypothetical protein ABI181_07985 [Mycobacteriaceae bacterium]
MNILVTASPHWVSAAVLLPWARPFVRIDGTEHDAQWKQEVAVPVDAGEHVVETFIRYKGFAAQLGTGRVTVTVHQGRDVTITARTGWANNMPLVPTEVGASG